MKLHSRLIWTVNTSFVTLHAIPAATFTRTALAQQLVKLHTHRQKMEHSRPVILLVSLMSISILTTHVWIPVPLLSPLLKMMSSSIVSSLAILTATTSRTALAVRLVLLLGLLRKKVPTSTVTLPVTHQVSSSTRTDLVWQHVALLIAPLSKTKLRIVVYLALLANISMLMELAPLLVLLPTNLELKTNPSTVTSHAHLLSTSTLTAPVLDHVTLLSPLQNSMV